MGASKSHRMVNVSPRSTVAGMLLAGVLILCPRPACGQPAVSPPQRFRESVSIPTESAAVRQLETIRLLLTEEEWPRAVEKLRFISDRHGQSLVSMEPGRYLNVDLACNLLAARFPHDALAAYRKQIDPQAREWFERGRDTRNPVLLHNVVRRAFVSSYADDALFLLGEWAWERGDIAAARRHWEQLIPLPANALVQQATVPLRYPDTNIDRALILARLVLCSAMEGDLDRARLERQAFADLHPNAAGELAGRKGNLAEILADLLVQAEDWNYPAPPVENDTFAGNPERNAVLPRGIDVGARKWSVQLGADSPIRRFRRLQQPRTNTLSYFPVAYKNVVLVNDASQIRAIDVRTGKAAWPIDKDDSGVIYPTLAGDDLIQPTRLAVGVPRYTMTVDDGRLFAKMGTPITGWARIELRRPPSNLICLDLEKQGKLNWLVSADELGPGWAFEGSPVVLDNRVYVALRRALPQTQLNVACYNASSGKLNWNRSVCAAVNELGDAANLISHHLLTLGDRSVYYATHLGAVASLNMTDGAPEWVVTYESRLPQTREELNDPNKSGLTPCLYHDGIVFTAPNDSSELLAIDAETGVLHWTQPLEGLRHLLGTAQGVLIVGGDRLWGLDVMTGAIRWQVGYSDSRSAGYGRGLLAGEWVYWPTREEIFVVHQRSGAIRRRISLLPLRGETGGNLSIIQGHLLIARPEQLVAFGEFSRLRTPAGAEITSLRPEQYSTPPFLARTTQP